MITNLYFYESEEKNVKRTLVYFVRFCAGSILKIENKNIPQQRTLPSFQTISIN